MRIQTMDPRKVKRGWEFDADVVEAFEAWIEKTGLQKNVAAQLGLWSVMSMDGNMRDELLEAMVHRQPVPLRREEYLTSDDRDLLRAFHAVDVDRHEDILHFAKEREVSFDEHDAGLIDPYKPSISEAARRRPPARAARPVKSQDDDIADAFDETTAELAAKRRRRSDRASG